MHWLILSYEPVSTFELRPSNTTKTGGKTLLVPTPYALKMAFLDRIIRYNGLDFGQAVFPKIRDLQIGIQVPEAQAINRTFQKILRPKSGNKWNETIAMREFCVQGGSLGLALGLDVASEDEFWSMMGKTASAINYFGQRGSFFQLTKADLLDYLPDTYVDASQSSTKVMMGFLQRMDDMESVAQFEDISTFQKGASGARKSYNVIFPYQVAHHGHNHTVWERVK